MSGSRLMYEPYPIYNMNTGKVTAREPWLLPKDAFTELYNCHLRQGVLEKRQGYSSFGTIVHTDTDAGTDTNPANAVMMLKNYNNNGTDTLLAADVDRINKYSGSAFVDLTRKKIRVKHGGVQTHAPAIGDTIQGVTSGAEATIEKVVLDHGAWADGDADGTVVLENTTLTGNFISGETLRDKDSPSDIYGTASGAEDEQEFTGDDDDYFCLTNWQNVAYITNGVDQIQKYNGSTLSRFYIDLDVEGGPDNDVNTCKIIALYHSRLVLLNVTERGTDYVRRARWSEVADPDTWKDANYNDADTNDVIQSAAFVNDELIVIFDRSIRKLIYTGDADLPFRWELIDDTKGTFSPNGFVHDADKIVYIGQTDILATDGRSVVEMHKKIPEEILGWNLDAMTYCNGHKIDSEDQYWFSYAASDSSTPDNVLVYDKETQAYANYAMPAHVFGETRLSEDLILDDIEEVLDTIDYSFDDRQYSAGHPIYLFGDNAGEIYKALDTAADDGSDINFYATSGRWNPFKDEGLEVWFGWVDFLVDTDADITFDVQFFLNTDSSYHTSHTVTCDGSDLDDDKVWKRVFVNCVGRTHQIKIIKEASARPRIHAIVPYFKRGAKWIN